MNLHVPALGRRPTDAERVDQAVTAVLADVPTVLPPALASELATARAVRTGLHPVPPGADFEADLGRRLAAGDASARHRLTGFVRHHQHRLVLTGAVGSVLVSTAGAAVVAWRLVHR